MELQASLRHPNILSITAIFFAADKHGLGGVAAYIEMLEPWPRVMLIWLEPDYDEWFVDQGQVHELQSVLILMSLEGNILQG